MIKQVFIKTYNTAGTIKGYFLEFIISSFETSLFSGLGELSVTIPEKFDDFGENDTIGLGYELKVYIADQEQRNGLLIYSGEISDIRAVASDTESVEINCVGYISQLANEIYDASGVVFKKYSATDPTAMMKDIIDNYRTNAPNEKINYTASSMANTGKSGTIQFYLNSSLDAIKNVASLIDYDWIWYVDETNTFNLKEISTTPDHYFIFNKDVIAISFNKSIKDLKNAYLFSNGLNADDPEKIFKLTKDTTSVATYGRRFEIQRDDRFKLSAGGYIERATKFLNTYKDPLNTVSIRIIDSNLGGGYDIESIKVGDTCKVLNISPNNSLTDNMLITNISYNIDYIDLTVVDTQQYLERVIQETKTLVDDYAFSDNLPTTYTI